MKKRKKRVKKNNLTSFFIRQYNLSWDYIKESKTFICGIIGIFFIFTLLGFIFPAPEFLSERILEIIEELLSKTEGLNSFELILYIFINNFLASLLGLFFGLFFGIFPLFTAIFNGYIIGFVSKAVVFEEGFFSLWRLLPHGIFELPAVFISLGLGLKVWTFVFEENIYKSFKDYAGNSLRVFIFVVFPLLVIAAIIEGFLIYFFS